MTAIRTAPAVRDTLTRVVRPSWAILGALAFVTLLGVSIPVRWQYAPLVVSILLFGLPHGAIDHLTIPRARTHSVTTRSLATVGLLYLVLGGAFVAAWFVAPVASFVAFILLTWFHWGQGDLYVLYEMTPKTRLSSVHRILLVVVHGGLPMLVPLLAFPRIYRRVASLLVGTFRPGGVADIEWLFQPEMRLLLGVGFFLLVLATLALDWRRSRSLWRIDAVETTLLTVYFAAVPPILAIGVYFCVWHSLRHIARVVCLDDASVRELAEGNLKSPLRRFVHDATPLTVGALVLLAGLAVVVPSSPATTPEAVGLYLVFLAALTLPHVVVVTILDRVQGIW
ncbi:Brp/Blh family beta-carotene 15,15'-dioxygenase [Haladaptatus litoreus]|nr:Brp/Blh family beta-carotene 15,15'-dioxygenase [Haladaptatus litoreus]